MTTLAQLKRLVGNPDAYAVQQDASKDFGYFPVREPLTDKLLAHHLDGQTTIGTYIGHKVAASTVARTLVFDIDTGDYGEAESIRNALLELGFPNPFTGIENSGRKGYHVWLPLQVYRPNTELRRVGRAVLALSGVACEVFPKQDEVRDLGNLVKLPGGIHRATGVVAEFLTNFPIPVPIFRWEGVLAGLPEEIRAKRGQSDTRFPCMEAIQTKGVAEGGRNNQLMHLAVMLRRAGVSDENVELVLRTTNERCLPPVDDDELHAIFNNSLTVGPLCSQLPEERQCGELCLSARLTGLYTRPGQLRHAADGSNVVVTVVGRKGNVIEFAHDDVGRMKAVLNE